jgi:hypothetical protein
MIDSGDYIPFPPNMHTQYLRLLVWLDEYGKYASRTGILISFSAWCEVLHLIISEMQSERMKKKFYQAVDYCLFNYQLFYNKNNTTNMRYTDTLPEECRLADYDDLFYSKDATIHIRIGVPYYIQLHEKMYTELRTTTGDKIEAENLLKNMQNHLLLIPKRFFDDGIF